MRSVASYFQNTSSETDICEMKSKDAIPADYDEITSARYRIYEYLPVTSTVQFLIEDIRTDTTRVRAQSARLIF